tara:strand:- start:1868 stop:2206 length:339 start_codon:yes stop_codon:yes gene_type:complete
MNKKEFESIKKYMLDKSKYIMDLKQPEYTNQSDDVLQNFKQTAKAIGITPMEVWAVFFNKHIQAILSHAGDVKLTHAEPIDNRYADAINYLFLGIALIKETNHFNPKNILDE